MSVSYTRCEGIPRNILIITWKMRFSFSVFFLKNLTEIFYNIIVLKLMFWDEKSLGKEKQRLCAKKLFIVYKTTTKETQSFF